MRSRTILTSLAMWLTATALCFGADLNMGTWKLNEAKSHVGAGAPKNTTVVYAAAGDKIKVTVDGVDGQGKPTHNEWTGQFDGKDYPVTGDPNSDTRSYTEIDSRTLEFTGKKGSKVTISGRVVLAADGKSRTVTVSFTDAKGNTVNTTAVYDKQ